MRETPELNWQLHDDDGWLDEVVWCSGLLWDVTGVAHDDGTLWLSLSDHYGADAHCVARADEVRVALQ